MNQEKVANLLRKSLATFSKKISHFWEEDQGLRLEPASSALTKSFDLTSKDQRLPSAVACSKGMKRLKVDLEVSLHPPIS